MESNITKFPITIMNFSHIYESEHSLHNPYFKWIDCSDIVGTNCYLDEQAEEQLVHRMKKIPIHGIHFIDSGNYHYISKLWTDRINKPFSLIVFDHHTDMQPSLFEELMSCGCWVKAVLDTNPFLKKVILVGAKKEQIEAIEPKYKERIISYSEQSLQHKEAWRTFSSLHLKEPVYVSVDKDVLNTSMCRTNWDQGSLSLFELEQLLYSILQQEEVLGIDICGEMSYTDKEQKEIIKNDRVNQQLIQFIEKLEG